MTSTKSDIFFYLFAALVVPGLLVLGCGGNRERTPSTAATYYEEAQKALEKGRCLKATDNFQRIVTSFPGSDLADDAQFGLAESYLCAEDYITAIFEYERLREYRSEWSDDAQYKIALCYYHLALPAPLDQSDTYRAIMEFRRFLEDYPGSPLAKEAVARVEELRGRLGEKAYRTAERYARWEDWNAALIYYEIVLAEYGDTKWVEFAHFGMGEVLEEQDQVEEALAHFREVLRRSTDDELTDKAQENVNRLEQYPIKRVDGPDTG